MRLSTVEMMKDVAPKSGPEEDICKELREEIRLVKFPEKKKKRKTVTILTQDGKRVKQVKQEDEELLPVSLKLEKKSMKGDVYLRADGKRVRLVKRKEKKRRAKLMKDKHVAEVKRLRELAAERERQEAEERQRAKQKAQEAKKQQELAAERERQEVEERQRAKQKAQEAKRKLIECDWSSMSWEEAEREQDRIFKQCWRGENATQSDQHKKVNYAVARNQFEGSHKKEPMETDEQVEEEEDEASEEVEEEEEAHEEEEEMRKESVSVVKRMSEQSIEAWAQAQRMKLRCEYAEFMGNLLAERFRYVGRPRHPTQ